MKLLFTLLAFLMSSNAFAVCNKANFAGTWATIQKNSTTYHEYESGRYVLLVNGTISANTGYNGTTANNVDNLSNPVAGVWDITPDCTLSITVDKRSSQTNYSNRTIPNFQTLAVCHSSETLGDGRPMVCDGIESVVVDLPVGGSSFLQTGVYSNPVQFKRLNKTGATIGTCTADSIGGNWSVKIDNLSFTGTRSTSTQTTVAHIPSHIEFGKINFLPNLGTANGAVGSYDAVRSWEDGITAVEKNFFTNSYTVSSDCRLVTLNFSQLIMENGVVAWQDSVIIRLRASDVVPNPVAGQPAIIRHLEGIQNITNAPGRNFMNKFSGNTTGIYANISFDKLDKN